MTSDQSDRPGSPEPDPRTVADLVTPALVVDRSVFDRNVATMASLRPGSALRPHVKAFKSTVLAHHLERAGHRSFCAATVREIEGMAAAGFGHDLLLANEVVDYSRLTAAVDGGARVTVAVDSPETLQAAAAARMSEVLIDVDVGLPRCGCTVAEAGPLADRARELGLEVRGVMGYEGHLMMVADVAEREARVEKSMTRLLEAHAAVGGDVVSAGGTGTHAVNRWASEIQAGSYCLMDTHYGTLEIPFDIALAVVSTVISVSGRGLVVLDAGLKALAMDHGNPTCVGAEVLFCSDEHTSITPLDGWQPTVGERVALLPAHVDPTVAKHRQYWVLGGPEAGADRQSGEALASRPIIDRWPIDLRHW